MIDMTEPVQTFGWNCYSLRGIEAVTGINHVTVAKVLAGKDSVSIGSVEKVLHELGYELVVRRKGE